MSTSNRRNASRSSPIEPVEARRLLAVGEAVTSFGTAGVVALELQPGASNQALLEVAVAEDDSIFAGGFALDGTGTVASEFVVKLDAEGDLVTAFGGDGIIELPARGPSANVTDLLPLPDGNLLVARANGDTGELLRLLPTGGLDPTFATAGRLDLPFRPVIDRFADGSLIAAGNPSADDEAASVVRLTADGAIVSTTDLFALDEQLVGGVRVEAVRAFPAADDAARLLVLVDVQEIDQATFGFAAKPERSSAYAISGDGTLDADFGDAGEAIVPFSSLDFFSATSLDISPAGGPVIGITEDDGESRLASFDADGSLVFNNFVNLPGGSGFGFSNVVADASVLDDGTIVVAGYSEGTSDGEIDPAVRLVQSNGLSDTPDLPDGVRSDAGAATDLVLDATLDNDGNAVLVGRRNDALEGIDDVFLIKIDVSDPAPPPPAFATLDGQTLRVVGTPGNDQITLAITGGNVVATLGLDSSSFPINAVANVTVEASAGADLIDVDSAFTLPTTLRGGDGDDSLFGGAASDTLDGGLGNDRLGGRGGDDLLEGHEGDDTLLADTGNDRLVGDTGRDTADYAGRSTDVALSLDNLANDGSAGEFDDLDGSIDVLVTGTGNDTLTADGSVEMIAGAGDDTLVVTDNPDSTLDAGPGNDAVDFSAVTNNLVVNLAKSTLIASGGPTLTLAGVESVTAGTGNDSLTGTTGSDTLFGGDGSDTLVGNGGNDSLIGASGDDDLEGAGTLNGGSGDDTLTSADSSGNELVGASGNDRIITDGSNADAVLAGPGDDVIIGSGDLDGGTGNDRFLVQSPFTTVRGGTDFDVADFSSLPSLDLSPTSNTRAEPDVESVIGTAGDDVIDMSDATTPMTLFGGTGNDVLLTGAGDDFVDGGTGDDTLRTGLGSDTLAGGAGNDSLEAGEGTDRLYGLSGNDTLLGQGGRDSLRAGTGNDLLEGGDDNDLLLPGLTTDENDTVSGGAGGDIVHYRESTANLVLERGGRFASDIEVALGGTGDDDIRGFLRIDGGPGNDTLEGLDAGGSALLGGEGNDTLVANTGDGNFLDGGLGDDSLRSAEANDTLAAGLGADFLVDTGGTNDLTFADAPAGVTIDLRATANILDTAAGFGTIAGTFANVQGTAFADVLTGDDDRNWLAGGDGDDLIRGGSGPDVLRGDDGADTLIGDDGPDLFLPAGLTANDGSVDRLVFDDFSIDRGLFSDGDDTEGRVRRLLDLTGLA
ncbi:MAG: calcium-binding protein [Planctomycetota bacterium]